MSAAPTAEERRARNFLRRSRAAQEGRHLPSVNELLLGMPWFGGEIEDDAKEFAERLLLRFFKRPSLDEKFEQIREALLCLTTNPTLPEFLFAAEILRGFNRFGSERLGHHAKRCDLYAACFGCVESALRVAAEAVDLVERDTEALGPDDIGNLIRSALGWLRNGNIFSRVGNDRRYQVASAGAGLLQLVARSVEQDERHEALGMGGLNEAHVAVPAIPSIKAKEPKQVSGDGPSAIVFSAIGNRDTSEGRRVAVAFSNLLGRPLPLVPRPDLAPISQTLRAEFPYAENVIDAVLRDVALRPHVGMRPLVLVGKPGTGKSRFARRAMELLGVPAQLYHCGGVADASLAGTARRWSTGEPSLPVALVRQYGCASPAIILDEIEKVGTSRHNGNVLDALLGLLERETASNWHDPYIESPVNLAHVIWIGTANSVEGLSPPLRDRCRILEYAGPDHRHLPILANTVLGEILSEQGLDIRWASPLSGQEIEALARAWGGGSIRILRRFVEGVLDARAQIEPRH